MNHKHASGIEWPTPSSTEEDWKSDGEVLLELQLNHRKPWPDIKTRKLWI